MIREGGIPFRIILAFLSPGKNIACLRVFRACFLHILLAWTKNFGAFRKKGIFR